MATPAGPEPVTRSPVGATHRRGPTAPFPADYADRYMATRPRSTAWVQPMPEPLPYERQAAKTDLPTALFEDPYHYQGDGRAVWRPPNTEQLAKLEAWAVEQPGVPPLESAHVAVIDGYQDPTPGYAGPLAVLVFMHSHTDQTRSEGVTTVALSNLPDAGDGVAMTECGECGFTDVRRAGTSCPECDDGLMREGADQ